MLNRDEIIRLYRADEFEVLHEHLDAALAGASPDDRHSIAHWRSAALEKEKRYEEALEHLALSKSDFGSKTLVHHMRASILEVLGRDQEALDELQAAPLDGEIDLYYPLVVDAKFYILYFRAARNMPVDPAAIDEIPEGYRSVLPGNGHIFGAQVSKDELAAMIGKAP